MEVTFDKSAVKFIIEAMGYHLEDDKILSGNGYGLSPVKCNVCDIKLYTNNLGGFKKAPNDKINLICNHTDCLRYGFVSQEGGC